MEIVQQNEKELVLKDKLWILLFFVFPSIGIPVFTPPMIVLQKDLVIKASCQRVEPTQVNCQVDSSKYFGLIKDSSTSLTRVTEAKFNSQKKKDRNGDTYFDYFVTLVSQTGKEVVSLQGNSYIDGFKGNPQKMNQIVAEINTFINNSTKPSLFIHYDLRFKWKNLLPLAISITFIAIGILIVAVLYLRTLILNKSERQLTYEESSLLNTYTKHYSFVQIKELIIDIYTDSDGDKFCSLKIVLVLPAENQNHQREVTLIKGFDIEKVKNLANTVADLIEIPYQELSN
ncbi:hypothetical protein [Okeania sp. KiyG1]|uniref:hypothetical protein n=1 Tax=Okeania sp. KiyG1 TaxID=2720165 RepID=UPI001920DA85|nr:hypothetical protein [Okeania sp. KiyG1]GGA26331.1 hypothetical protein CYANOKiyG1_42290 [Okeania sp. KiyG1]